MSENKEKTSEFGRGFIYNLVLFAKHWRRISEHLSQYRRLDPPNAESRAIEMWFNGASDHFYELEVPERWEGTEIGDLAKEIQERSLEIGHGFTGEEYSEDDFVDMFNKLEGLCRLIDKELGVESIEADYS